MAGHDGFSLHGESGGNGDPPPPGPTGKCCVRVRCCKGCQSSVGLSWWWGHVESVSAFIDSPCHRRS
eukprot:14097445-Alexandrium_andersonii.AAC.1